MNRIKRIWVFFALFILTLSISSECTDKSNPVDSAIQAREGDLFSNGNPLFTPPTGGTDETVDTAVLCEKAASNSGTPINIPYASEDHYWTVVVGLQHTGTSSGDVPYYAWLKDGDTSPVKTGVASGASGSDTQWAFPKVDAMYIAGAESGQYDIYVAVTYMWKTAYTDWHLMVWIGHWNQNNFPTGDPTSQQVTFFEMDEQWYPDVAFNFNTGDLYLVYTSKIPTIGTHPYKLLYRRIYLDNGFWNSTGSYYACDPSHGQNAWGPRIDIGNFKPDENSAYEPYVAIAYTARWFDNRDEFSVATNYWPVSDGDADHGANDAYLYIGSFENYDAGTPDIDISPNTNSSDNTYWSLVFVQEVSNEVNVHKYEVWGTSSFLNGSCFPIQDSDQYAGQYDQIQPSIVNHYNCTSNNNYASVSMMQAVDYGAAQGIYNVVAAMVNIESGSMANQYFVNPIQGGGVAGYWDPFLLTTTDPGVRSDIAVFPSSATDHNKYFLAYLNGCSGNATNLMVAWGDANED